MPLSAILAIVIDLSLVIVILVFGCCRNYYDYSFLFAFLLLVSKFFVMQLCGGECRLVTEVSRGGGEERQNACVSNCLLLK